jgi:RES domain-containing protein
VPTGYRLFRARYASADATGASIAGGRWKDKGIAILYASSTLSLACLEILVHIREARVPVDYAWVRIEIPEALMGPRLDPGDPADEARCRLLGSEWARNRLSAAVEAPSVIIPTEYNLLLHPGHPRFMEIGFSEPVRFRFDSKLLRLGPAPV